MNKGKRRPAKRAATKQDPLFRALRERDEALAFQAASNDILAAISRSTSDARPVFDAIVNNVLRLFGTRYVAVFLIKDGQLHLAASSVERTKAAAFKRFRESFPQPIDDRGFTGRALRSGKVAQMAPVIGNPAATPAAVALAKTFGYNAMLLAPLVRNGEVIGAIGTTRPEAEPFDARQLALFKALADQAVIAIENARLFNETKEALERQTATADILKVISSSPTDTEPVFDTILQSAMQLCEAHLGILNLYDGIDFRTVAQRGGSAEFAQWVFERGPFKPDGGPAYQALAERRAVQVADAMETQGYREGRPSLKKFVDFGGVRTFLAVPLIRDDEIIGNIGIYRPEVRPFTDKQIALVSLFASQAVIAIENVRLFNETKEALEHQKATSGILGIIASSIQDAGPVFNAIATSASAVIENARVQIFLLGGGKLHHAGGTGLSEEQKERIKRLFPVPLDRSTYAGCAMLERRVIHVPDVLADRDRPGVNSAVTASTGLRAILAVPMLHRGEAVGCITTSFVQPAPFSDRQISLLRSFADQAVIAIENARLFTETKEALERQTATADVLGVIAGSPSEVQPVFDAIVRSALRLIGGTTAHVTRLVGDAVHLAAFSASDAAGEQALKALYPMQVEGTPLAGVLTSGTPLVVADAETDPRMPEPVRVAMRARGVRGVVIVPMMRKGEAIGTVVVNRDRAGEFSDREIALLKAFADQAVIAIENVRLFNETKEALERQTATSEVLKTISRSTFDLNAVLQVLIENATRLAGATQGFIFRFDGRVARLALSYNAPPAYTALIEANPIPPGRGTLVARTLLERRPVHIPDVLADPDFTWHEAQRLGRFRSMLGVPMLREGNLIGVIAMWSEVVKPFNDKQIELVSTFADQAVIAIENVRLFNETKEALERQTATAEILGVIGSSLMDTRPVFDAIVRNCGGLFAESRVALWLMEDDRLACAASSGYLPEPMPLDRESGIGTCVLEGRILHLPDLAAAAAAQYSRVRQLGLRHGYGSGLYAPLVREGKAIGGLSVLRRKTGAFDDKDIALLGTFASQAVIAIENARLFREIQEKSAQLEVANKHKSDFLANMSHELRTPLNAIIGFSEVLSERMFGDVNEKQAEYLKDIHESGRHLLSLINDILDLSKIEAGRMELELSSFHLPNAVSNAMTLVRERAQRHGIALGSEIDPAVSEFEGDERKVKQILLNLLSNAVKFTPDGGRVDVKASAIDGRIEIEVRDTGIGIAPEDHAAVFEEFKQVGRDYTRKAEGTGLGLALTKRLVELHGGEIALESAPGKGSTFTVRLPVR